MLEVAMVSQQLTLWPTPLLTDPVRLQILGRRFFSDGSTEIFYAQWRLSAASSKLRCSYSALTSHAADDWLASTASVRPLVRRSHQFTLDDCYAPVADFCKFSNDRICDELLAEEEWRPQLNGKNCLKEQSEW